MGVAASAIAVAAVVVSTPQRSWPHDGWVEGGAGLMAAAMDSHSS